MPIYSSVNLEDTMKSSSSKIIPAVPIASIEFSPSSHEFNCSAMTIHDDMTMSEWSSLHCDNFNDGQDDLASVDFNIDNGNLVGDDLLLVDGSGEHNPESGAGAGAADNISSKNELDQIQMISDSLSFADQCAIFFSRPTVNLPTKFTMGDRQQVVEGVSNSPKIEVASAMYNPRRRIVRRAHAASFGPTPTPHKKGPARKTMHSKSGTNIPEKVLVNAKNDSSADEDITHQGWEPFPEFDISINTTSSTITESKNDLPKKAVNAEMIWEPFPDFDTNNHQERWLWLKLPTPRAA